MIAGWPIYAASGGWLLEGYAPDFALFPPCYVGLAGAP